MCSHVLVGKLAAASENFLPAMRWVMAVPRVAAVQSFRSSIKGRSCMAPLTVENHFDDRA